MSWIIQFRTECLTLCLTLLVRTKITPKTGALPSTHKVLCSLGENKGKVIGNMALARRNYYLTSTKCYYKVRIKYSIAYTKDKDGNLKIILHDSHLPFNPERMH